jgi:phage tail-like protein
LLNEVAGWNAALEDNIVEYGGGGDLRLAALPGEAKLFLDGSLTGLQCPTATGLDECGTMFVLDAATNRVSRVTVATGQAKLVREIGGRGFGARQFDSPRGMAVLPGGGLAIADTNNHRVQIFSPWPFGLLALLGTGSAGHGTLEFQWPWGVVYQDGWLYIADRGNGRIQRCKPDGTQWSEIGKGVLQSPSEIAVSSSGMVAVVDAPYGGTARLLIFSGSNPTVLSGIDGPRSVAFDAAGNLFAGTSKGLVFKWSPDSKQPGGLKQVGVGLSGLDSSITSLAILDSKTLLAVFDEEDVTPKRRLWTVAIEGAFVNSGTFIGKALDSRIDQCVWHRVEMVGTVPDGCSLEVDTITSAAPGNDADVIANGFTGSQMALSASANDPDGLVQSGPGRYIRLRIVMRSDGVSSPCIHAIRVHFPRQSYLQYLPANFQQDDESRLFLDRFLSIFQTAFDNFDRQIDNFWKLFDPLSTPSSVYNWLAAWMALPVDPTWDMAKKRSVLKGAAAAYQIRGTVAGLEGLIQDYAGVPGNVLEHFRLRRWPMLLGAAEANQTRSITQYDARLCAATPLWSRSFFARLDADLYSQVGSFQLTSASEPVSDPFRWGAGQFSVFFPADAYCPNDSLQKVQAVVEREKPAHSQSFYVPVLARMRVGVQSSIGIDSYVSRLTYTVLNRNATLGYDSILAASPVCRSLAAMGAGDPPRTGIDTRLL